MMLPVSEKEQNYCKKIHDGLLDAGLRVKVDESQGSLSKRVYFAHRYRPYAKVIVGPKEVESGVFNLQLRGEKKDAIGVAGILAELNRVCLMPK